MKQPKRKRNLNEDLRGTKVKCWKKTAYSDGRVVVYVHYESYVGQTQN